MIESQASMQAAQAMHSYCSPSRISMPVGHTCTQSWQSMQSPSPACLVVDRSFAAAARFTAFLVIGNNQRVLVEHGALEARIGTHVLADLLAHVAGIAVGREAVKQTPEQRPAADVQREDVDAELAYRREIADEREAGPHRERNPQELLGGLLAQLC